MIAVGTCEWCGILEYSQNPAATFHGPSCPKADSGYFIQPQYASTDVGLFECSLCGTVVLSRGMSRHTVWHEQVWYSVCRQTKTIRRFEEWFASPNVNLMTALRV